MARKSKVLMRPYFCKICGQYAESDDRSKDICARPSCKEKWDEKYGKPRRIYAPKNGGGMVVG